MLGGDAARVLRRHIAFRKLGILILLLVVGLLDGNELVDVDLARGAVDDDLSAEGKMQDVAVAFRKRPLELIDERELVQVLLLAELHESFHHLRCHVSSSLPSP